MSSTKFPSPNHRFALRITESKGDESPEWKVDLIERASGRVIVDLGTASYNHLADTGLVWSADSKWAAYGTRGNRESETSVYFWNGSNFEELPLPDDLPAPDIKFRRGAVGGVKNYGGAVKSLRWLKSGALLLSSDQTMLSRVDGRSYTGVVSITIGFDARHHASIQKTERQRLGWRNRSKGGSIR